MRGWRPLKPVLLDAILILEEKAIAETFPHGARLHKGKAGKPDRFSPADEGQEAKTLKWLLDAKKERMEPDRIPHKDSTKGYTSVPMFAMVPDVGASPPKSVVEDYATENWQRFLGGLEALDSRDSKLYVQRRIKKGSVRRAA